MHHGEEVRRSMKGRNAKRKIFCRRTRGRKFRSSCRPARRPRRAGDGRPPPARRRSPALPAARAACRLSQACLIVAAAWLSPSAEAAEHMGQQPRAQEGVRHHLLHDRHRTGAAHREQRPGPGEVGRRRVLGQQMLDADLPVAGDLGGERAAVGLTSAAKIGRHGRRGEAEEDDPRGDAGRERRQVKIRSSAGPGARPAAAHSGTCPAGRRSSHGSGSGRSRSCPRACPRPACSDAGRRCAGPARRLPCRAPRTRSSRRRSRTRKSPGFASWPSAQSGSQSAAKTVRFSAWKASPWA